MRPTPRPSSRAEPTAYRWFLHRRADTVTIRLVEAAGWKTPEHEGSLLWRSEQPTTTLARTVLRAFDTVADDLGEAAPSEQALD